MNPQIRQLEIRQEARFVLWALRCAMAHASGHGAAEDEINRGFEVADVLETRAEFWAFANALAVISWSNAVWHAPCCCCTSSEELLILQALAESGERHRSGERDPACWWRMLLPAGALEVVDAAARAWVEALDRAGVVFPRMTELVESLGPLQDIAQSANSGRLN